MVNDWEGQFGDDYTKRNLMNIKELNENYKKKYGISRSELNKMFLSGIPADVKILEVGANIGLQLELLKEKFIPHKLIGIDKNKNVLNYAIHEFIYYGDVFDIPYIDNAFDMVLTSGLLIHIEPSRLKEAMGEIVRCSKRYIWGFEYYARRCIEIEYHGQKGLLWKNDFAKLYRKLGLKTLKEIRIRYLEEDKWDTMFLMEKQN